MAGKVGRPSKADLAARAAAQAEAAAKSDVPRETIEPESPDSPQEPQREYDSPEPQRITPRNETRRQAMQEIEDRDIHTKTGLGMELGLTDEEKPKVPEKTETPQDLPPPTAESMLQGGKFSQSPQTVRVKVDGEEFDAPVEDVEQAGGVRAYQTLKATENRLRAANEALAELKKAREEVKQPKTEQSDQDFFKSKIDIIRFGTPEEAYTAWNELEARKAKPAIDEQQLIEKMADRQRHDEAVKAFDKEFTDIGASQLHLKLVVALREERLKKGHPGDWNQFYRGIGNEVRAVMPKQHQSGATPQVADSTSPASEKEARKASVVVSLPQAGARASVPEEPKPETREDMLNQMRKKRGFPTS